MYVLFTVLAGILWGCISLFLKPITAAGLSSLQVMMIRGLLSAFFMFVLLAVKDRKLLKIEIKDIWMFIGTGIVSLTFFSICYFKTILEVGTSIAVILLYTSPIFVLLMSVILFRERITLKKIIALLMTFAGCVFVTGILSQGDGSLGLNPLLIGLGAGFGYALYSIFSRYALKKYNALTVTFYTFLFSGVSLLPFVHVEKIPACMDWKMLLLTAGIALICTVLPYIFYTLGLTGLETSKAAILVTIEPLVGTLIGFLIWREEVSVLKIIGIILIFISVVLLGLEDKTKSKENE